MKPRDKYPNPRQRISGPAAWGHRTNTIVLIEPAKEGDIEDPHRLLIVAPRNAPGEERMLKFNDRGWLEEATDVEAGTKLEFWLTGAPREFHTATFTEEVLRRGVSLATAKRWLKDESEPAGRLIKLERGIYQKR